MRTSSYRMRTFGEWNPGEWLQFSAKGILLILLFFLFVIVLRQGYSVLEESGAFRVRKVTVQGNRVIPREEILALAEIKQGSRLLGFKKEELEQRISRHPWIDRVRIQRSWPYTLSIRVYEHRPLAVINIENLAGQEGLYYVDHQGKIFVQVAPSQDIDFPVITGFTLAQGKKILDTSIAEKKPLADALQFLQVASLGNPILPIQAISEVHVKGEEGIIMYLTERPFPIYVGYGNIKARYYQLVKLLERLYRMKKIENIREIRMDYQADRILVASLEP
ncbi:MAG: FtsQ-type POTRA domain-containing protein [Candidatus Electrothrix sp. AR3]|nr:FtsQ-type POTRA domain-containing protein [Candidatus Electrothrix sp. AR3]